MKRTIATLTAAVALSACTAGDEAPPNASPSAMSVALEGSAAASCIEVYSLDTITNRAFAFDGTVIDVPDEPVGAPEGGDAGGYVEVTFEVHEWFRGGDGHEVIVQMMAPGVQTSVGNAEYGRGSRLLVSGEPRWGGKPLDAAVAWYCGFTRTQDPETMADWRDAFS